MSANLVSVRWIPHSALFNPWAGPNLSLKKEETAEEKRIKESSEEIRFL